MPIGNNRAKIEGDKLISKTTKARKTDKADTASDTRKTRKPTPYTTKATFYLKPDLYEKLKGFAFWDRHSITEAVNIVLEDGLKGKKIEPRPRDR